jgi:hypothetical protein
LLPDVNDALQRRKKKGGRLALGIYNLTWSAKYSCRPFPSDPSWLSTGTWLQLYELLPSRSSPSSALHIWHLALHPLLSRFGLLYFSILVESTLYKITSIRAILAYQRLSAEGPGHCLLSAMALLQPCYPQMRVLLFFNDPQSTWVGRRS